MAKQNNPIKRKELYDYLSQNKMTDLSFDQFSSEYGLKSEKFNDLFTYLNNNEMTTLTPNQFKEAYFGDVSDVKKKDDSDLSIQQTGKDSSTPPKINTVSLDSEDLKTTNDVTQPLDSSTVRNYRNWKESTKVTDEDLKTIEETITKELEPDTFDKIGLAYNTVADSFMNFFNSDPVAGTGGLTGDLDLLPRDTNAYNYISEELDQAESELREKLKGSKPDDYNKILRQRAIEIKKEKLKKGLVEKKQRNFLNELPVEDRENLFDFSENSIIAKNEELSKSVESANLLQNEFKEKANTYFTEVKPLVDRKKEIESMTFIDEEWASTEEQRLSLKKEYEELTNQITGVLNNAKEEGVLFSIKEGDVKIQASNEYQEDLKSIQEKIKNTDAEIGTLSEEMDLFNRSYNMFATAGAKTTAAGLNIIGGLADLQVMYDKEILGSITEDVPLVGNVVKFRAWATQNFSDKLNEWSEDLRGKVQKDFSISDADSFDDYLTYTLTTTGETLPYVAAATSNPLIGATIIGGSTTGNKYRQIQQEIEQGVEYNKAQIITSSLMTGVTEAGLGFLPTVSRLRGFSRVYKSAPKSVRDKAVRSTMKGAKKYLMPAASESLEEGGVQVLENFNDAVILRKENVNIFDNVTDPLVAGGLVGFLLPGFGAVTGMAGRTISTIKEKRALKKNAERVLEVEAELAKGGLSEDSMDAYKSEIIDLTTKNRDIILSNAQNIKKATKDEFETLKVLDKNISSYSKEAKEIRENTEVDVNVKKKQLSDLKKLAEEDIKEKDEILKTLKDRDEVPQEVEEELDDDVTLADDLESYEKDLTEKEEGVISENLGELVFMNGEEGVLKLLDSNNNMVVFETSSEIIDLGLIDDIGSDFILDQGISKMPPEGIKVSDADSNYDVVDSEGVRYKFLGRRRDKKGKAVVRVREIESGLERRFVGDKAERILKDQSLKKPRQKPLIKLKEEGKEVKVKKEKAITQEEADSMTINEIAEKERELKEETDRLEQEFLSEAVKEGDKDREIAFTLKGKDYKVRKKKDGTYAVSQKNDSGKYVGRKDQDARAEATKEYERLAEERESERLEFIDESVSEKRKEDRDFIESLLDTAIDNISRYNKRNLNAIGLLPSVAEASLRVIRAGYKAGKTISQAMAEGYRYAKNKGYKGSRVDFDKYAISELNKGRTKAKKEEETLSSKPKDFKEAKPKDKSKRIQEVKKSAKTAINSYKKNRGGKYIPQNGELVRSLQINPELLSENDLLEFEEYANNVKGNRFNPIKSKPTTRKFAKIFNNQPSVEKEVSTREEKKEVDAGLLSEFESKKKISIENVAKDKITDFAFIKSITKDELKGFTNTDLEILNTNIDVISEGGSINTLVRSIMNSVKADRNNKGIQQELDGVKYRNLLRDSYDAAVNSIKNDAENRMFRYAERNQLRDLDNILKGKKSGKLYKYMGMESVAKGFGSYSINKQKGEGVAALDIFNVKREKVLKVNLQASRSRVNKMKFNAKIYLIQLQKFYEINKNIDSKKRIRPEEYIKASEVYAKSNRDDRYRENLTYVQDIYRELPKKNDGSIDVEASIKSLKKDEKQVFDIIENFNNNKGKQMSIDVATMEGKTPEIFDYYVPLNVRTKEKVDLSSIIKEADSFLEGGAYFSELGSLIERTAGVNPLDFNYVENFSRNVDKIYRSYHMLPAIKEFNSTMNRALNNKNIDENGRVFIEASKELFTKVFRNEFASSYYTSNSFAEKFAKRINEIGYYNQLADPMRAGVELTSNLSFAIINNPKELAYGLKNRTSKGAMDSYEDLEFIARIGNSAQSSRIFVASTSLYKEVEAGELTSSKKEPGIGRLIKSVNSILLEAPDRAVAIPLWEGSFKTRFKELTGKALDVNRMKEDNVYYDSVIEPLNESVRYADEVLSQGFSSLNPFESTPFSQLNPEERANILKMFNKYMTRFQMAEFSSIVKSVDALTGKRGDMSRGRGARLLGATLFRMSAYNFGMQFAYGTVLDTIMGVFGLESEYDEEEDKEFGKMLYNEGMSLAANVFVMRRLGNLQKVLASTGIESLNVGFGVDVGLRDDNSYNFRDSLTYSIIPRDENGDLILSSYSILKSSTKLLGAYSSFANSSIGLIENASKTGEIPGVKSAKKFETRRKADKKMPEFLTKFLLSTIRIPAPRLIRKALNYQQARSAAKSSKRAESIKDIIKSVEQKTGKEINSDLFRSEDELNNLFK